MFLEQDTDNCCNAEDHVLVNGETVLIKSTELLDKGLKISGLLINSSLVRTFPP